MSSEEAGYVSLMEATMDIGQRDSGHLAVSSSARRPDTEPALSRRRRRERGCG